MNSLKSKVEYIREKAKELNLYDIVDYIDYTNWSLDSGYIDVAVIGRFKSGKSSLINSIIGKEILPCGVLPLTTVAVSIYNGNDSVKVFFEDGRIEEIDISRLEDYVSEEKNPSNIKSVLRVEISMPLSKELRFFRFIDTPGLDYSQVHNRLTEKLYRLLECVIFCVSYDMPLSESEMKTVELLKKFAPEVIFVVTKVDLIEGNEVDKLVSFLQNRLKDVKVYPFSKKDPSLIERFKNEVLLKYFNNYSTSKEAIIQKRYKIVKSSFLSYLGTILKTLDEEFKKRKDFSVFFKEEKERIKDFEKNIIEISKRIKTDNTTKIMARFSSYHDFLYEKAYEILKSDILDKSKNLYQLGKNYENEIRRFLEKSIYEIFEKERDFILNVASTSLLELTKISNDFLNTTLSRMNKSIGLDIPMLEFERRELDISWSKRIFIKLFDINIDFLLPFLPIWMVKRILLIKLRSDLSFDIEKALIRASMDVSESINKEIDLFVKNAISGVKNKFKTIENIICSQTIKKEDIEEIIHLLTVSN